MSVRVYPVGALPTEGDCQATIIEAARALGYRAHHQRPATNRSGRWSSAIEGDKGFPDLIIAGQGRCWALELKRRGNRPSTEQVRWITALAGAGLDARLLIVPDDMHAFITEMQRAVPTRRSNNHHQPRSPHQ